MELVTVIGDGHPMEPLTEEDQERDDLGYTNPNLHRRLDKQDQGEDEISLRDYDIRIESLCSYRTTEKHYVDFITGETPGDKEIP